MLPRPTLQDEALVHPTYNASQIRFMRFVYKTGLGVTVTHSRGYSGLISLYLRASEGKVRIDRYHGEKLVKISNRLLDINRQITVVCYIVLGIIVRCE